MIRLVPAALLFAVGVIGILGCAMQPGTADSSAYAPYSQEDNPFCGALGNCRPLDTTPHPLRGSYGAY